MIESFRPGVVDRLGIGYDDGARGRTRGIVYCSTSGYGQTGPRSQWAGHDLNYLAVGGYLDCSGRDADGGPALPGATIADSAGGGMHAVIAILAALVRRAATGRGRVPRRVGRRRRARAHVALRRRVPRDRRACPGRGHDILTGRYACYDVYRCADDRWVAVGAIEPHFFANLCRALGCEQWIDAPDRRRRAGRDPRRLRAPRSRTRDARRVGRRARPGRHVRRRAVAIGARARRRRRTSAARDVFVDATRPSHGDVRAGRLGARGHGPRTSRSRRARRDRHRHRRAAARGGLLAPTRSRRCAKKESWRDATMLPADVETADRRGAVRGDRRVPGRARLHLDDVRVGRERQPAVLGRRRRRRDHRRPDRAADDALGVVPAAPLGARAAREQALPLQVHFDLKETLRPARSGDDRQHDRVPRAGAPRRRAARRARSCAR